MAGDIEITDEMRSSLERRMIDRGYGGLIDDGDIDAIIAAVYHFIAKAAKAEAREAAAKKADDIADQHRNSRGNGYSTASRIAAAIRSMEVE